MNIVIFDDNLLELQKIKTAVLKSNIIVNIVLETTDKNSVEKYILFNDYPSLFILDIIEGKNTVGFSLCDKILLNNKRNLVLFITNNPKYIICNVDYKLFSVCFILKYSKYFELEVKKAIGICSKYLDDTNYYNIQTKSEGIIKIHHNDIYFFEKIKNKNLVCLYYKDGEKIFSGNLNKIVKELKHFIVRCHGSFAVNPYAIKDVITKEKKLTFFKEGIYCFYSRLYSKKLKKWIK